MYWCLVWNTIHSATTQYLKGFQMFELQCFSNVKSLRPIRDLLTHTPNMTRRRKNKINKREDTSSWAPTWTRAKGILLSHCLWLLSLFPSSHTPNTIHHEVCCHLCLYPCHGGCLCPCHPAAVGLNCHFSFRRCCLWQGVGCPATSEFCSLSSFATTFFVYWYAFVLSYQDSLILI